MGNVTALPKQDVNMIYKTLQNEKKFPPIYSHIWKVGCNLGLRVSDLLSLKFDDIDENNRITLIETKTRKPKTLKVNDTAMEIIRLRRKLYPDDIYLFQSHSNRAAVDKPIGRIAVSVAFKKAGEAIGVHIGTHSMRKSFGKALFNQGKSVALISRALNHSSIAVTMRYLGIEEQDVLEMYDDVNL